MILTVCPCVLWCAFFFQSAATKILEAALVVNGDIRSVSLPAQDNLRDQKPGGEAAPRHIGDHTPRVALIPRSCLIRITSLEVSGA